MPTESENNETTEAIVESAREGIRRAQGDQGSMEEHSLTDRIAADRYSRSKDTLATRGIGMKLVKLRPPGALG